MSDITGDLSAVSEANDLLGVGTERCNKALEKLGKKYDVVVNIQGDVILHSFHSKFLKVYSELQPTPLQQEEDLEQLKVLENGHKMKVIKVDHEAHGVDVEKIKSLMRERNLS